jgi:hypothetical protein
MRRRGVEGFAIGMVIQTGPARPRTRIGWAFTVLVGVPLLLLAEYLGGAARKRAPSDPGRRVSFKRIAWLLGVLVSVTCVAFLLFRAQSQLLGDPLGRLGHQISPHYH